MASSRVAHGEAYRGLDGGVPRGTGAEQLVVEPSGTEQLLAEGGFEDVLGAGAQALALRKGVVRQMFLDGFPKQRVVVPVAQGTRSGEEVEIGSLFLIEDEMASGVRKERGAELLARHRM